ncbi:hypothetical protein ONZ45_g3395 [Pleurotus djamor]|nr:hypothetical protein ONZ45_g3395 [Pleurotus djamor]
MDASTVEKALISGSWPSDSHASLLPELIVKLARDAVEGRFRDVLLSQELLNLRPVDINEAPISSWFDLTTSPADLDETAGEFLRLILAIALLQSFVQANWTGPDLDFQPLELFGGSSKDLTDEILTQKSISELAYGGEPAYHLTNHPILLRLAQILLDTTFTHCNTAPWWRLRATIIHQHVLDETVPPPSSVVAPLEALTKAIADPELAGRLHLETGLLDHTLGQDREASDRFVRAARATGLEYELTGALGKRTKFQQKDLSQLVLLAESRLTVSDSPGASDDSQSVPLDSKKVVPETLELNDDTLLEKTQFTSSNPDDKSKSALGHLDPSSQPALHPVDQCILLSLCLNVQNTSPSHGLTAEQMAPYVDRVISHPRNWSIHTMALLLRSRLESSRTRTVERATLQLQALIDQMPTADSSISERLLYLYDIPLPSKWELEKELALQFLKLGVVKSALEIFERLEMWEEVVKCWGSLEQPDKAKAIVKDLLDGKRYEAETVISRGKSLSNEKRSFLDAAREAKLLCLLGDLEPDQAVQYYTRAWEVSKETSGRAMRSLGGYYFARGEYAKAITSLKRAVAINPLYTRSWFILGCACVREEDWEGAKTAFGRCVAIDDEDGESWNNLASVYLRMGTIPSSEPALQAPGDEDTDAVSQEGQTVNGDAKKINGETAMALHYDGETSQSIPFAHKMLAFRALKQGLRFSYDNWRMWSNYMIVAMDVGEVSEACRALGRVVEETSAKVGAESVDEDVLERLVRAVTAPAESGEGQNGGEEASRSSNEANALFKNVSKLLETIILPRVSSPRIFRAYARLLTWQSRWEEALKAHLDGYRCGIAGSMEKGETDPEKWREAVVEVEEIVDILRNFGPRIQTGGTNWRLQARSIVRTFMGRMKDGFEDEPEWSRLVDLQEELRKVEG